MSAAAFRLPIPDVMAETGHSPGETAFVGDQIYTDTLCAKCCGALAVTVKPLRFTNPWLLLRYWLEFPFRLAGLAAGRGKRNTGSR